MHIKESEECMLKNKRNAGYTITSFPEIHSILSQIHCVQLNECDSLQIEQTQPSDN